MANCPNCGSNHIQLKQDSNVNWGRAVVGWALFGVVGGAVGAVTGDDRNVNACLDCGTSWKAADLHKLLQIIKKLTSLRLDLSEEVDRAIANDFIYEFSSDLEAISNIEMQGQRFIQEMQKESNDNAAKGCSFGCVVPIALGMILPSIGSTFLGFLILILPIVGVTIGNQIDRAKKKSVEQEIENINRETKIKILDAEKNLKAKVVKFMNRHPLIDQEYE